MVLRRRAPICRSGTHRVRRLLLTAPLVLALVACETTPPTVNTPVTLPERFSASGTELPPERWWETFADAGLAQAVELALDENFAIAIAWDRLAQAEAIARREGAARVPAVDVDAGASRSVERDRTGRVYSNRFLAGLSAGYEVDLWGRIRSAHEAALHDVAASQEDVFTASISLSASVATVWYELAEALEQVRVLGEQTETNAQVLELLTERFRQGMVQAADVLRQRQLVQSTQGLHALAEQRAAVLRHLLAVLLGRPPGTDLGLPAAALVAVPELPSTGVPADLLERRPDVRAAYLAVLAQDRELAAAIAAQYPRISLAADGQTSAADIDDLFDNWLAGLAASLVQPLFDGGRRRAEVDRNRALLSEALHRYGQAILEALRDVEDALAQEAHQRDYLRSLEQQFETAGAVIERTRSSYLNGTVDYIRVLEALTSRQSLERTLLSARRQLLAYRVELLRALAGPFPLERPEPAALEGLAQASDGAPARPAPLPEVHQ